MRPPIRLFAALVSLPLFIACRQQHSDRPSETTDRKGETHSPAPSGNGGQTAGLAALPAAQRNAAPDNGLHDQRKYKFAWMDAGYDAADMLVNRIAPPPGSQRVQVAESSFAGWLRHLPLKPEGAKVYLYNGEPKAYQGAHHSVVDIDVGKRDLQQCADAVMRLRAEYLYANGRRNDIGFDFTNGERAAYPRWVEGYRPVASGNSVDWRQSAQPGDTYNGFRQYMDKVFTYAGTYSLSRELQKAPNLAGLQAGDIFIQGGFPGHAVLVVDVAKNESTGETYFLLLQSYMPAQNMHILHNPGNQGLTPWYALSQLASSGELPTPEWTFHTNDLKRFGD